MGDIIEVSQKCFQKKTIKGIKKRNKNKNKKIWSSKKDTKKKNKQGLIA